MKSGIILWLGMATLLHAQSSDWAKFDGNVLTYKTTPKGDRIMDFSYAGFEGGGVALPASVPIKVRLSPSGSDDTTAIQDAIDTVSTLAPDFENNRGAVLLEPGTFHISSTITIAQSGVVLTGSGSGITTVQMDGSTGFLALQIGQNATTGLSNQVDLTNSYIPSGSLSVAVSSVAGFAVGDSIQIRRPVTSAWVQYMGMTSPSWLTIGTNITTDRTITAINSEALTITLNAPISDSFDSTYLGSPVGTLSLSTITGRIQRVGLQNLTILAPTGSVVYKAVDVKNVLNGWIKNVVGQETQNAFTIERSVRQFTLDRVTNNVTVAQTNSAPTADFSITGSQIFVNKCESNGTGDWPLVTSSQGTGPIAVLNFSSTQNKGIAPHQRWATGLLVDNATLPNNPSNAPGIAYTNRGSAGSGQGWTTGWSVAWNVTSPYFAVSAPPGAENWCIGCMGAKTSTSEPDGIFDSLGTRVTPSSLYLEQLRERKGQRALNAIGYSDYEPNACRPPRQRGWGVAGEQAGRHF